MQASGDLDTEEEGRAEAENQCIPREIQRQSVALVRCLIFEQARRMLFRSMPVAELEANRCMRTNCMYILGNSTQVCIYIYIMRSCSDSCRPEFGRID
jgi:hypothetical protein